MSYKKIAITADAEKREILIALLSEIGYEGFEENESELFAYIEGNQFDQQDLEVIINQQDLGYQLSSIEKKNWNEEWEKNFTPVIVEDFCTVRAEFHSANKNTPYEIIITPKMSFGTGHHATTQLMMEAMRDLDIKNKKVFDFGCGTGILAILASKLGANTVVAVDHEEWAYENTLENSERNGANNIEALRGSLEDVVDHDFDIILANINRHILLQYMKGIYNKLKTGGTVLMSGIIPEDKDIISNAAMQAGFALISESTKQNWLLLKFAKNSG